MDTFFANPLWTPSSKFPNVLKYISDGFELFVMIYMTIFLLKDYPSHKTGRKKLTAIIVVRPSARLSQKTVLRVLSIVRLDTATLATCRKLSDTHDVLIPPKFLGYLVAGIVPEVFSGRYRS